MNQVVGYKHSEGVIAESNFAYNNEIFFVVSDDDPTVAGLSCSKIKLSHDDALRICACDNFPAFIGKTVSLSYSLSDNKAVLTRIEIIDSGDFDETDI